MSDQLEETMPSSKNQYHAAFFGMQAGISLLTMIFAVAMMVRSSDNIQTFLPVLTSVSAYWLPAPTPPPGMTRSVIRRLKRSNEDETVASDQQQPDVERPASENAIPRKSWLQLPNMRNPNEFSTGPHVGRACEVPVGITLAGAEISSDSETTGRPGN